MADKKNNLINPFSDAFIQRICALYGDRYDDRIEDSKPPTAGKKDGKIDRRTAGKEWHPGLTASHKSLTAFQKELSRDGIHISTSKIRKILISGGVWTTERSREVQALFSSLTQGSFLLRPDQAIGTISERLGISKVTVIINLPYINGVNCLEEKSKNAIRCSRYRGKREET